MNSTFKKLLLALSVLIVCGCAPVISKQTLETTDREIKLKDILDNPSGTAGKNVVLGGTIIKVENQETKTIIEVLEEPLSYRLAPVDPDKSSGRFLVEYKGFKDPAIYSGGKTITVAGTVKGFEKRPLDKTFYNYPVVSPVEDYLWGYPETRQAPVGIGVGIGLGFTHIER